MGAKNKDNPGEGIEETGGDQVEQPKKGAYETVSVSVNSGGKELAKIDVEQFKTVQQAVDFFESDDVKGEGAVVKLINRQYKTDRVNKERTALTSQAKSAVGQIKRALRDKPEAQIRLDSLLAELGLADSVKI